MRGQKGFLIAVCLGAALACDENPVRPPTTGGIAIVITPSRDSTQVIQGVPAYESAAVPADATDTNVAEKFGPRTNQPASGPEFALAGIPALDGIRAPATRATPKTVTA